MIISASARRCSGDAVEPFCCDLGLGSQPVIQIAAAWPALLFPDEIGALANSFLFFDVSILAPRPRRLHARPPPEQNGDVRLYYPGLTRNCRGPREKGGTALFIRPGTP